LECEPLSRVSDGSGGRGGPVKSKSLDKQVNKSKQCREGVKVKVKVREQ
jgi:hypothetical protein